MVRGSSRIDDGEGNGETSVMTCDDDADVSMMLAEIASPP
jgi:hypothetical protein